LKVNVRSWSWGCPLDDLDRNGIGLVNGSIDWDCESVDCVDTRAAGLQSVGKDRPGSDRAIDHTELARAAAAHDVKSAYQ